MEKTIKMFFETTDGVKLEQDVPNGLVEIYLEKGWKVIENPKSEEKVETTFEKQFFGTKKGNKRKKN